MMTIFINILLTLIIACLLFFLFRWVKNPLYRVDKKRLVQTLEMVLTGQATENQWFTVFNIPIRHNPELEEVRQRCLEIEEAHYIGRNSSPYLFNGKGLSELKTVLVELKSRKLSD